MEAIIDELKAVINELSVDSVNVETYTDIRNVPVVARTEKEFIAESIKSLKDFIDANWERFKYAHSYDRRLHIYSIIAPIFFIVNGAIIDEVVKNVNGYRGLTISKRINYNCTSYYYGKDVIDIWF